jgi:hypothetical protein
MSIDAALLRKWSEELCRFPSVGPEAMAAALGLEGLTFAGRDTATIEPPPAGTSKFTLHLHPVGFDYIEIELSDNTLTRAQLDAHFGASTELPRMGPFSEYKLAYRVEVLGAPFTCAVIPSFPEPPTTATAARLVLLRRD